MIRIICILFLTIIGITSCKKEVIPSSPPYIEQWWDKYYGTYTVIDTANDFTYEMEISRIDRYYEEILTRDSVLISNVKNKFDLRRSYLQSVETTGAIGFGIHNPIKDRDGYSWAFSGKLIEKEGTDTLDLLYTLSNIAFYLEEDTELYECICVDLAVKK